MPEAAQDPGFGERLDAAMRALFMWCCDNEVPVMAHANHSNGPYPDLEDLAGAPYWAQALDAFRGLRVSLGHFGDTDTADHQGERARAFAALMSRATGSAGAGAFADSGFFADALTQTDKLRDVLLDLYRTSPDSLLAERFMYGTDWHMLVTQADAERYFGRFASVLSQIDAGLPAARVRGLQPSEAFFGWNAVEYLGLRPGSRARQRLDRFNRTHRVPHTRLDAEGRPGPTEPPVTWPRERPP